MAHLFPIHHETLKKETLKKVANRVVVESFENSRKVSQGRCVNLMRLVFYYVTNLLLQNECMFLKFFSFTFMKVELSSLPNPLE